MRQIIILVVVSAIVGSAMSYARHPRAFFENLENDIVKRGLLGNLPLVGDVLQGTVSGLVKKVEPLPQNLLRNPLGTLKSVTGEIPVVGPLTYGVLNTVADVAGGLPIVGGLAQDLVNNPLGTVQNLASQLPIVGGSVNGLLKTADGVVDPQGTLFSLLNQILNNVV
ncbi:hypothetical protein Bpfe_023302 [Biomphalaria pfeifferi]|uniref:Uncharacterized protein n=1 Tax=Biomphalaria pfeifferi TaxID=112525 RepID=A0AAD8B4N8_BIOPF|nr:hypothetical protein Bpfe_023302 [Biomphalaria pfeifferi]